MSSTDNTRTARLPEVVVVPVAALGCLESPVEGGVVSHPQLVPSAPVTIASHHPLNLPCTAHVNRHLNTNYLHLHQQSPHPLNTHLTHSLTGWNQDCMDILCGSSACSSWTVVVALWRFRHID